MIKIQKDKNRAELEKKNNNNNLTIMIIKFSECSCENSTLQQLDY